MTRPSHIWLTFTLCLAVLLAAMGWVSLTTLRLDRAQMQANQQAELEERVRLALWRMDSLLTPLIVEESARPFHIYTSFHAAERAYTKGYSTINKGDVLVPSPLLSFASSNILLHFQFSPDGRLMSPQAPLGNERDLAEASYTTRAKIDIATTRLAHLQKLLNQQAPAEAAPSSILSSLREARPAAAGTLKNGDVLINACATSITNTVALVTINPAPPMPSPGSRQSEQGQMKRGSDEWNYRANVFQSAQQQIVLNNDLNGLNPAWAANPALAEGQFKAHWIGPELLLARRVNLEGRFVVQGCWLNWPALRQSLLTGISELFPAADVQPMTAPAGDKQARMLAALPVKLITGPVALDPLPAWSPSRITLAVAWGGVLLAALAVALLLHGTLSLSERRGAFVSAVTHELRTPLTTFKMYSEMLAEDMVPDAEKRKSYLATLCSEANRLSHLVENVLAYARLERGSARSRVEKTPLSDLIERVKPRLVQRTEQAGMKLVTDSDEGSLNMVVHVDVSAVEQILFNLVDNACKYAAPGATEKIIHLEALPDGKFAMLRVRDHGQGISAEGAKRLFQPFSKSAHEAAHTAPGVGLGLALCRRLSRSLGGDLRLDDTVRDGACFVLRLPISPSSEAAIG